MYDSLLMVLGSFQLDCWQADAHIMPWPAIFMADWVRGLIDTPMFLEMMGYMAGSPLGDKSYLEVAQCMVDQRG